MSSRLVSLTLAVALMSISAPAFADVPSQGRDDETCTLDAVREAGGSGCIICNRGVPGTSDMAGGGTRAGCEVAGKTHACDQQRLGVSQREIWCDTPANPERLAEVRSSCGRCSVSGNDDGAWFSLLVVGMISLRRHASRR